MTALMAFAVFLLTAVNRVQVDAMGLSRWLAGLAVSANDLGRRRTLDLGTPGG